MGLCHFRAVGVNLIVYFYGPPRTSVPTFFVFHAVTFNLNSILGVVDLQRVGTDVLGGPQNVDFSITFGGRPMVAITI